MDPEKCFIVDGELVLVTVGRVAQVDGHILIPNSVGVVQ